MTRDGPSRLVSDQWVVPKSLEKVDLLLKAPYDYLYLKYLPCRILPQESPYGSLLMIT